MKYLILKQAIIHLKQDNKEVKYDRKRETSFVDDTGKNNQ